MIQVISRATAEVMIVGCRVNMTFFGPNVQEQMKTIENFFLNLNNLRITGGRGAWNDGKNIGTEGLSRCWFCEPFQILHSVQRFAHYTAAYITCLIALPVLPSGKIWRGGLFTGRGREAQHCNNWHKIHVTLSQQTHFHAIRRKQKQKWNRWFDLLSHWI